MPRPWHATVVLVPLVLLWPMPHVLDARQADFIEDNGTGRVVGAIDARLSGCGGTGALHLEVRARGPRLDPIPGFEGIHGVNVHTAREIERVLEEGALRVVTRSTDGVEHAGRVTPGPRVALPRRQLTADGRLLLDARTDRALPASIRFDTGELPPGRYRTEVLVQGRSRLRAEFELAAGTGRITALGSRGEEQETDR